MNIFKVLMARYGVMFFFSFMASFILFVALGTRSVKPIVFPFDVYWVTDRFTLYLPFGISIALGAVVTLGFEIYKGLFKR